MKRNLPFLPLSILLCLLVGRQTGHTQVVQTGKSYVNLTKGVLGGTIEGNDILEIRATIAVGDWDGSAITRVYFVDTIPVNTTYVINSLKILTNEGLVFKSYSDASDADQAMRNGNFLRINMGSTFNGGNPATVNTGGACNTAVPDAGTSGGRIRWDGRPSFYNGVCIMSASYKVRVNIAALPGTIINMPGGAFRYRGSSGDVISPLPAYKIAVQLNIGLCSNAIGANAIIDNGGTFGAGTLQNRPASAIVPNYTRANVGPNNPNDGEYAIINNLSPSGSTNMASPNPNNTAIQHRVFRYWDIMGDHTGAAAPAAGNPPVAPGTNGGYFVAIDAGYANNNAIQQTVGGLCPNTYYEFSAWFKNVCKYCSCDSTGDSPFTFSGETPVKNVNYNAPDSSGVNPNLTFSIDGIDYYTTGTMKYTGQWIKRGFIYKTGPAQTSFTATIRNNAAGGGGNDWGIDDVTLATCTPNLNLLPSPSLQECYGQQINMSCIVRAYFANYVNWRWEKSTDGGATWNNTGVSGTFTYTIVAGEYQDTAFYPTFLADSASHNARFRIRVASTIANLDDPGCSFVASTLITVLVNDCSWVLKTKLHSFSGSVQQELATLRWSASGETAQVSYDLESSEDQVHFTKPGTVQSGIPGQTNSYAFTDPAPLTGLRYYRIRIREGAQQEYSRIIALTNHAPEFAIRSLINPFYNQISFELTSPGNAPVMLTLVDMYGRTVKQQTLPAFRGVTSINLLGLEKLPAGIYVLHMQYNDKVINRQVVKTK